MRNLILAIAAVVAAGSGTYAAAQDASKGESVFRRCRACHTIGPEARNKAGPALTGIVGRRAGTAPGFNYSDAMKAAAASGLVWTEDKLTQFLRSPETFMPNNVMAAPGVTNPEDLQNLVAFLKLHK
jgi:cytochrome c